MGLAATVVPVAPMVESVALLEAAERGTAAMEALDPPEAPAWAERREAEAVRAAVVAQARMGVEVAAR